jgi:hypothetical protein
MKFIYYPGMKISRPEDFWSIGESYAASFRERVEYGRVEARRRKLAIVSIARNSMPHLQNTLRLIKSCGKNTIKNGTELLG